MIKDIHLSGDRKDNRPYFKLNLELEKLMSDHTLWKAVEAIEEKIVIFEKLREAMRIAPKSGSNGSNNILEQFFRSLKRANRRRTGNASSRRMLQTILAETPLVRNLENPAYMNILLNGKSTLEAVFSGIDIESFRKAFREAQATPEKIPAKLKPLIAMPDFPEKLVIILRKAVG